MKFTVAVAAVISLILEIIAVYLFFFKKHTTAFFPIHILSSLIISSTLGTYVGKKIDKFLQGFFLSTFISLFIPVTGTVLLLTGLLLLKEPQEKIYLPAKTIDTEEILYESVKVKPRRLAEGALRFLASFRKKEEALLFLKDILSPFSIEVARNFL